MQLQYSVCRNCRSGNGIGGCAILVAINSTGLDGLIYSEKQPPGDQTPSDFNAIHCYILQCEDNLFTIITN